MSGTYLSINERGYHGPESEIRSESVLLMLVLMISRLKPLSFWCQSSTLLLLQIAGFGLENVSQSLHL